MDIRSYKLAAVPLALLLALGLAAVGGNGSSLLETPAVAKQSYKAKKSSSKLTFNGGDEDEDEDDDEAKDDDEDKDDKESKKSKASKVGYHWKLKEVDSFKGAKDGVRVSNNAPFNEYSASDKAVLGIDGESLTGKDEVVSADYIAGDYYAIGVESDDVNRVGIYSLSDGEILAPEAAIIKGLADKNGDVRFLMLTYGTEMTKDKDEAFFYSTKEMFSLSPGDDDTLWKGYAKIYDLEKESFVKGLKIDDPEIANYYVTALADGHIMVGKYSSDEGCTLYDAKGKEVWSGKDSPSFGYDSFAYNLDGKGIIVGLDGDVKETLDSYVSEVTGPDGYYQLKTDDGYTVIDSSGDEVFDGTYKTIYRVCNGLFAVDDGKESYIVNEDDEVIVEGTHNLTYVAEGISVVSDDHYNEYTLLFGDEVFVDGLEKDPASYNLVITQDDKKYLNLSTGKYDIELDTVSKLGTALVSGRTEGEACYGVFDLFTGEQLLDCVYDNIVAAAGGYLYCFADGEWTVFEASIV